MEALRIKIEIDADGAGVGRGMSLAAASVVGFERTATQSLNRVKTAFAGLSTGTKVLGGVGLGLGALSIGLGQVVGPAIEFESAFAGVLKTVDGSTGQLDAIRTGLIELSTVMPTSASDLASIAENAGQLGVAAPDVLEFTKVIAQLGETTDLDFDSAAQSLARFLNITGNDASITSLADVIVELGNNSATTESQIVDFATRLASAFTVAGASEDQILSLAAAFSSLGLRSEAGGSALSRIITTIADAAINGGRDLEVFAETAGLIPEQFARIAAENPVEALLLFGEGLRRVIAEGGSVTPILEELELGGLRTAEAMRLLALNSEQVRATLALGSGQLAEGGAAAEEYGKRVETTAARLEILRNRLQSLAIAAGTPLLDSLALGADIAGDSILVLADNVGSLIGALGPVGTVIAALAVDIALVGPVSIAAQKGLVALAAAGGGTAGAMTLASQGIGTLITRINPLVAAGAALGGLFINTQLQISDMRAEAELAASVIPQALETALDTGEVAEFAQAMDVGTDRLAGLREELERANVARSNALGIGGFFAFDPFLLADESKEVRSLEEAIAALESELDGAEGATALGNKLELLQAEFGLTEDEILSTVAAAGEADLLLNGLAAETLPALRTVLSDSLIAAELFGDAIGPDLGLKIVNGTASMEEFEQATGLTGQQLQILAGLIDEVDFADLFDEDPAVRAEAMASLFDENAVAITAMADAVGVSNGAFLESVGALGAAAAAHNELQEAVQGVLSSLDALAAQQQITADAQLAFEESLVDVTDAAGLEGAAGAMRVLIANMAASGATYGEVVTAQGSMIESLRELGLEAGLSTAEVDLIIASLGAVPLETIALLVFEAGEASALIDTEQEKLLALVQDYPATLSAVDLASEIIVANQGHLDLFPGVYIADLVAEDETGGIIQSLTDDAVIYRAIYDAILRAIDEGASGEIAEQTSSANFYQDVYNAALTASDDGASGEIGARQGQADAYDGGYEAILSARSPGSTVIQRAVNLLAGFRSKSITLTTFYQRVGQPFAEGGFSFADGGIAAFDSGSIADLAPRGAVVERPGRAQIYSPVTPGRFFAEPQTGGEAYIPLAAANRSRSIGIWEETGRLLGVLANGGIQRFQDGGIASRTLDISRQTVFAPQVNVAIDASGSSLNERELAGIVRREISGALDEQARRYAGRR